MKDFNANFKIEKELWIQFKQRYSNASARLRELILNDLQADKEIPSIQRDDITNLYKMIFTDSNPVQLVGKVGIGKTSCIKKLIEQDHQHVYIVLDCHNEYDNLPNIQTITTDLQQSSRIIMPKQVSAARGLYPLFHNQILSQLWPSHYVVVVEEAHRYPQIKELLKEARKFVKVIAVCQEPLGDFCPRIRVVV